MKVKIFGSNTFESKWVPVPRGWIAHTFLCNGEVAVHDAWYGQGYQYAEVYNYKNIPTSTVLDWLQENVPNTHIMHPSGAVIFKDQQLATRFRQTFAE